MLNQVLNIFTKEFQKDVEYIEFKNKMRRYVKLNNESESIDKKMERLKSEKYVSDCRIEIGEF